MKLLPILLGFGLVALISAYSHKEEEEKYKEILSPAAEPSAPTRKRRPHTGRLPDGYGKPPQGVAGLPVPRPSQPTYSLPLQDEKSSQSKSKGDDGKKSHEKSIVEAEAASAPIYAQSSYSIQLEPYHVPKSDKKHDHDYSSASSAYTTHIAAPTPSYPSTVHASSSHSLPSTTAKAPSHQVDHPNHNEKSGYNQVQTGPTFSSTTSRPQVPHQHHVQHQHHHQVLNQVQHQEHRPLPQHFRPIFIPLHQMQALYPSLQFLPHPHFQHRQPHYQGSEQGSENKEQEKAAEEEEEKKGGEEENNDNGNEEEQQGYGQEQKKEQEGSREQQGYSGYGQGQNKEQEGSREQQGYGGYGQEQNKEQEGSREQQGHGGYEQEQNKEQEGSSEHQGYGQEPNREQEGSKEEGNKEEQGNKDQGSQENEGNNDEQKNESHKDEKSSQSHHQGQAYYGPRVTGYQVFQTHHYRTNAFPAYQPQQPKVEYRPQQQVIAAYRPQPIPAIKPEPAPVIKPQPQSAPSRPQAPLYQIHFQTFPAYKTQVQAVSTHTQQATVVPESKPKPPPPTPTAPAYHQQTVAIPTYQQQTVTIPSYQQQTVTIPSYQQQTVAIPSYHQQTVSIPSYQQQTVTVPSYQQAVTVASVPAYQQQSVSSYHVAQAAHTSAEAQPAEAVSPQKNVEIPEEVPEPEGEQVVYPDDLSAIPGEGGRDYPQISRIPESTFNCIDKLPGYYADVETQCQVWHICDTDSRKESFLCPNGTIYHQEKFVCDWWYNVDCSKSASFYYKNEELYKIPVKAVKEVAVAAAPQYQQKAEEQPGYGGHQQQQFQSVQTNYPQVSQPTYVLNIPSVPAVAVKHNHKSSGYATSGSHQKSSTKGSKSRKNKKSRDENEEDSKSQSSGGY